VRRAARRDANEADVVKALASVGASVFVALMGDGFPDLVVGYRGRTYLMEVKDGRKPEHARPLTPMQAEFIRDWKGQVIVVTSPAEAVEVLLTLNRRNEEGKP
jgi:hypothetical protein